MSDSLLWVKYPERKCDTWFGFITPSCFMRNFPFGCIYTPPHVKEVAVYAYKTGRKHIFIGGIYNHHVIQTMFKPRFTLHVDHLTYHYNFSYAPMHAKKVSLIGFALEEWMKPELALHKADEITVHKDVFDEGVKVQC